MDFDKGLGEIMTYLYDSGSGQENTLMCIYGDHSWYEKLPNTPSFAEILKDVYDPDNFKEYSTILGFYNPTLNESSVLASHFPNHTINKPTCPSVIVPTILDLMGEPYNPRLYQAKSIFDPDFDENAVFYSH
ncbi:MAG: hypothetical protein MJ195_02100 [Mycoplasmoidaceae bacterium]|nr:hypothetical protein [Mycoplasmoidaceae bacterium]